MNKFKALLLCLIWPVYSFSQQQVVVEEVIKEMSKGTQTGFEVVIPEVTFKSVQNNLNRYLRKESKSRAEEANGEIFILGAVNKNIHPSPFNIYVKHLEVNDGVRLTAFFTPDDTVYFSNALDNEKAIAIKKYLRDFALQEYRSVVKDELEVQKRRLTALENELESMVKAKQRSEKNINEAKRDIESNNRSLVDFSKLDTIKSEEILRQKDVVSRLQGTGGEEEKLAAKKLKSLENEKRKLEREREKTARDTDNQNIRIENEKRSIEKNLDDQESKKKEIEKQKEKVKSVEGKLGNIL